MYDPAPAFLAGARLQMIDPSSVDARGRGRADQIGEGDAVIAGAGQGGGAIAVLACGAPHVDVREQRMPEVEPFLHGRNLSGHADEARGLPMRAAVLPHTRSPSARKASAVRWAGQSIVRRPAQWMRLSA